MFGENQSAVDGDIDGLSKLEGAIVRIGEPDKDSGRDTRFGPDNTSIWGHDARPKKWIRWGYARPGGPTM